MKRLSTGQKSTLGTYRGMCNVMGLHKATAYFDKKITKCEKGKEEEVLVDETQMVQLIAAIERGES